MSRPAFETAKSIHRICNAENEEQIEKAVEVVEQQRADDEITEDERDYLIEILDTAQAGDWEDAEQMAREMIADQSDW